jgi:hypothetical protein
MIINNKNKRVRCDESKKREREDKMREKNEREK